MQPKAEYEITGIYLMKPFVIPKHCFKQNTLIQDLKTPEFNIQGMAQSN